MKNITVNGLKFKTLFSASDINAQVQRISKEICNDYKDKAPIFVCVLTGSVHFASDLFRACEELPDAEIAFIRFKSYDGMQSSGSVKTVMGLCESIENRHVIIIEDIVDTGRTAVQLVEALKAENPASVKFATLIYKPTANQTGLKPDYVGMEIEPKFILGYGLDFDGKCRNLRDIYVLDNEK